ncbi:hypothetical protein MBLNU230_g4868t1 [Neophaeotheca triangularis]
MPKTNAKPPTKKTTLKTTPAAKVTSLITDLDALGIDEILDEIPYAEAKKARMHALQLSATLHKLVSCLTESCGSDSSSAASSSEEYGGDAEEEDDDDASSTTPDSECEEQGQDENSVVDAKGDGEKAETRHEPDDGVGEELSDVDMDMGATVVEEADETASDPEDDKDPSSADWSEDMMDLD